MVYFPARKCYHTAKIVLLVIFVIVLLTFFEYWSGGKRGARAFSDPLDEEYERQILEDEARIVPGLGEGGEGVELKGVDKQLGDESIKTLAMNVYLSERIAYNRTLKDVRNPACDRVVYDAELPSASVILIFHNEPYSVVIRTIWSVIENSRRDKPWYRKANYRDKYGRLMSMGYPGQDPNSPLVYLKEIILVDDNSTLPELKGKLSHYIRTRLPPDLIRILRLPDRVGLTRARLAGARYAVGDVLIFLDSHCEGQPDWLRPMLQAIKDRPHAVMVPIIDVIDAKNFHYSVIDTHTFQVGGFTFTGHFTWIDIPQREKKRRGSDISPTWSPTMAGGLFAINRQYFWEVGAYDEQMAGWGGENLEMSFRVWQCGGTLETVPCSRVGHVFRSFHPYGMPSHTDTHGINTARMAEVWMDEYAELFYLHRPDLRNNPRIGDVTHRKILREKLKCKNFEWYLNNIYKEKFVPIRDAYGFGRFRNPSTNLCLDTLQRDSNEARLGLYPCHDRLQPTQYFILSYKHELRGEEDCAYPYRTKMSSESKTDREVVMEKCQDTPTERKWQYHVGTKQLQHSEFKLCLDASPGPGGDVIVRHCSGTDKQKWEIDYAEYNDFGVAGNPEPSDQVLRLASLRGQKRKSRSLLSYDDQNLIKNDTVRRHTHKKRRKHKNKKKKIKNKFILKLVRNNNNSEEHLEVDIHCKHTQLYPNNTFVRDLVTILNDQDIKVINNGHVFERNRVSQVDPRDDTSVKVLNKMSLDEDITEKTTTAKSHAHTHSVGSEPRAHRIIIEDFVELPSHKKHRDKAAAAEGKLLAADSVCGVSLQYAAYRLEADIDRKLKGGPKTKRVKKRRLRPSGGEAPSTAEPETEPPRLTTEHIDSPPASIEVRQSSVEDTALLASGEDWPVGESRFRKNVSRRRQAAPLDEMVPYEQRISDAEESQELQLVMKTNFTLLVPEIHSKGNAYKEEPMDVKMSSEKVPKSWVKDSQRVTASDQDSSDSDDK